MNSERHRTSENLDRDKSPRPVTNGTADFYVVAGNGYSGKDQFPPWLCLERSGTTVTAYQSDDGNHCFTVGSTNIPMGDSHVAGVGVAGVGVAANGSKPISLTCDHVSALSFGTGR
jgi:hypothetical protein